MEPIYKALTRPAMLFGVPMVPLVVVLGAIILLAFWINLLIAILIIPAVFIMQQITKKDDMAFIFKNSVFHKSYKQKILRWQG